MGGKAYLQVSVKMIASRESQQNEIENQLPIEEPDNENKDENASFWTAGFSVVVQRVLLITVVVLFVAVIYVYSLYCSNVAKIAHLEDRQRNVEELSGEFEAR